MFPFDHNLKRNGQ